MEHHASDLIEWRTAIDDGEDGASLNPKKCIKARWIFSLKNPHTMSTNQAPTPAPDTLNLDNIQGDIL